MKNSRKLTKRQKEFLDDRHLDPKEFIFMKETSTEIEFWDRKAKNTLIMSKLEGTNE